MDYCWSFERLAGIEVYATSNGYSVFQFCRAYSVLAIVTKTLQRELAVQNCPKL